MRRTSIGVALACIGAALLAVGPASAANGPCYASGTTQSGACLHWPDFNRANRTQVDVRSSGFTSAWVADRNTVLAQHNAGQARITFTQSGAGATGCNSGTPGYSGVVNLCLGDWNYACNAQLGANRWLGCAHPWVWTEWNGSAWVLSAHLFATIVDMDANTYFTDGSTQILWTPYERRTSLCHEIGHTMGLDHSFSPRNPGIAESCITASMEISVPGQTSGTTPETLGAGEYGIVNTQHNHNDCNPSCSGYGYGDLAYHWLQPPLLDLLASARPILSGFNVGKQLVFLPKGYDTLLLPKPTGSFAKYVYVIEGEPEAFTAVAHTRR
jgi:hypothetical protein